MAGSKRMLIGVASTTTKQFTPMYNRLDIPSGRPIKAVIKVLALSCLGVGPYVYATYPADTQIDAARSKLERLWNEHRGKIIS